MSKIKRHVLLIFIVQVMFLINVGHVFFSTEEITITDSFTKMARESHHHWRFFFYELLQILGPLTSFSYCLVYLMIRERRLMYIWNFSEIDVKHIRLMLRDMKTLFVIMSGFYIYKFSIFFRLDPELRLPHQVLPENLMICIVFTIITIYSVNKKVVKSFDVKNI